MTALVPKRSEELVDENRRGTRRLMLFLENITEGLPGIGTVTQVSVASGNGFDGTVATDTSTPVITIKTTITGMLKGDGTSMSAAVAGTDYAKPLTGTANRITVTNPTTTNDVDISASYVGQTSITTLGTVTTGTWNGTAVSAIYGGTSQTTYTTGDILYASAANTLSKLPVGSAGDVVTVSGGVPTWAAPTASSANFTQYFLLMGA